LQCQRFSPDQKKRAVGMSARYRSFGRYCNHLNDALDAPDHGS
jgi:hypothetical protein